jgi:hypothetical protein
MLELGGGREEGRVSLVWCSGGGDGMPLGLWGATSWLMLDVDVALDDFRYPVYHIIWAINARYVPSISGNSKESIKDILSKFEKHVL